MNTPAELRKMVDELTNALEAEKEKGIKYRDQLLESRDKVIRQDYVVQNQKHSLENARKTLELITKENEYLKGLVSLWIKSN